MGKVQAQAQAQPRAVSYNHRHSVTSRCRQLGQAVHGISVKWSTFQVLVNNKWNVGTDYKSHIHWHTYDKTYLTVPKL